LSWYLLVLLIIMSKVFNWDRFFTSRYFRANSLCELILTLKGTFRINSLCLWIRIFSIFLFEFVIKFHFFISWYKIIL